MAHEELKALYEIDKQHSDTPWEFWEFFGPLSGVWHSFSKDTPKWLSVACYRRKPDAPVWSDDKEDARKWRKLSKMLGFSPNESRMTFLDEEHPPLIQGYTAEQWQTIIDGKFLCEFSDADWHIENDYAGRIVQVLTGITDGRFTGNDYHWPYCRPLRIKGVRQPWFGGRCPVDYGTSVYLKRENGEASVETVTEYTFLNWTHGVNVVEFIEL